MLEDIRPDSGGNSHQLSELVQLFEPEVPPTSCAVAGGCVGVLSCSPALHFVCASLAVPMWANCFHLGINSSCGSRENRNVGAVLIYCFCFFLKRTASTSCNFVSSVVSSRVDSFVCLYHRLSTNFSFSASVWSLLCRTRFSSNDR